LQLRRRQEQLLLHGTPRVVRGPPDGQGPRVEEVDAEAVLDEVRHDSPDAVVEVVARHPQDELRHVEATAFLEVADGRADPGVAHPQHRVEGSLGAGPARVQGVAGLTGEQHRLPHFCKVPKNNKGNVVRESTIAVGQTTHVMHLNLERHTWWPVGTYVVKGGATLAYMGCVPLAPLLTFAALVDLGHIAASLTYNLSGHAPWAERIDFLSILSKTNLNAAAVIMAWLSCRPANTWDYLLWLTCGSFWCRAFVLLDLQCVERSAAHLRYGPLLLCFLAVLRVVPWTFSVPGLGSYFVGFVIWNFRVPERWAADTLLNSVGWMHLCVCVGDALLALAIHRSCQHPSTWGPSVGRPVALAS